MQTGNTSRQLSDSPGAVTLDVLLHQPLQKGLFWKQTLHYSTSAQLKVAAKPLTQDGFDCSRCQRAS